MIHSGVRALALAALLAACYPARSRAAVLVELFTSQGCPNCPLAERVVERIGGDLDDVVFLAFHVELFDTPVFRDRFSRPEWTRRQAMYARQRLDDTLSTPEAIVAGKEVLVGSDEGGLREAIAAARQRNRLNLRIENGPGDETLRVAIERTPAGAPAADLFMAVFERHTKTQVRAAARPLTNDFVVKVLKRVSHLEAGQTHTELAVPKPMAAKEAGQGVAFFVQNRKTLEVPAAEVWPPQAVEKRP